MSVFSEENLAHLRLGAVLPSGRFQAVRRALELRHCKWDAQVGDTTALASAPLLMSRAAWQQLADVAEQLFDETLAVEGELLERPELHRALAVPRRLSRWLTGAPATPSAARVMRFDFHPTSEGWRVSEVNSDVPGGYAEATHLSRLMSEGSTLATAGDPTAALVAALARAAGDRLVVATCAAGFMEDQEVVSHVVAALREAGSAAELASLEQLRWTAGSAQLGQREIGAIFRFFQAEWLVDGPENSRCLFAGGRVPVANPGSAVLTESKRLPLVWHRLRSPVPTWRRLLPETRELRAAPWASDDGWLIKSAYCNNGDTVSIRSALSGAEWRKRCWQARLAPGRWVAQRRFEVTPLGDAGAELYPCVGVYVIDGRCVGAYGRVASGRLIDFAALDAALLIDE